LFVEIIKSELDFPMVAMGGPDPCREPLPQESRYIKPLVDVLKVTVMQRKQLQEDWDLVVDSVVHAINTRVPRVHTFSPAELLLGFNPNRTG